MASQMRSQKVLLLSFAFPPIGVQISPVAARNVVELSINGFDVDVICAHPSIWPTLMDKELEIYADEHISSKLVLNRKAGSFLGPRFRQFIDIPDPMFPLIKDGLHKVAALASNYSAIISISPFHSINYFAFHIKKMWPNIPWIATFYDPWTNNPLEFRWAKKLWHKHYEPKTVSAADLIVQSSSVAINDLKRQYPRISSDKFRLVRHSFDPFLYPTRPRVANEKFKLRFIGSLFGRRSPVPAIEAVRGLLARRPELRGRISLELIGSVDPRFSLREGFGDLADVIEVLPPVPYLKSLEMMYDADALLLIEADAANAPFMPSKLADYIGARRPIIAIAPEGECRNTLLEIGAPVFDKSDVEQIGDCIGRVYENKRKHQELWLQNRNLDCFDLRQRSDGLARIVREVCLI